MSLGGVQRRRHGGVTVLVVRLGAGAVAQRTGQRPLIVPGLAAVALAVHGALVALQEALMRRRQRPLPGLAAGPPGLPRRRRFLRLGRAQQAGHGQHPLNGVFRAE